MAWRVAELDARRPVQQQPAPPPRMPRGSLHASFGEEVDGHDMVGGRTTSEQDDPLGRHRSVSRDGRPTWQDRRSFLLAAVGAAIGTGNVWRFPYLCFKYGGGSFLVPYFFALFALGIPVMVLELGLGQQRQKGFVYTLHEIHPALAGLGWATVFNTFLSCVFYCLVMAWALLYLFQSFSQPWAQQPPPPASDDLMAAAAATSTAERWWLTSPVVLYTDPCEIPATPAQPQEGLTVVTFNCGLEDRWLGCTPPELQYALALPNTTAPQPSEKTTSTPFFSIFSWKKKAMVYQDSLGTNVIKTHKEGVVACTLHRRADLHHRRGCVGGRRSGQYSDPNAFHCRALLYHADSQPVRGHDPDG